MGEYPQFPPYLLALVRKHRVINATLAAVLKLDRTTVSKKLNSKRNVSFAEVSEIVDFFWRVKGIKVDKSKVL